MLLTTPTFGFIIFIFLIILGILYLFNNKYFKNYNIGTSDEMWEKYNNLNNCYSYAFNDISLNRKMKPQPGFKVGLKPLAKKEYTCENFIQRVLLDNPNAIFLGFDPKYNSYNCGKGNHLVFLVLDVQSEIKDYHFYRKDSNSWTHKPGELKIRNYDASNKIISNPFYSDKHYKDFNYSNCGYFCTSD
jgi:hypothetical protein